MKEVQEQLVRCAESLREAWNWRILEGALFGDDVWREDHSLGTEVRS